MFLSCEQAEEALAGASPEAAAAKGRAMLNLRLTEAEGGLLGRTLLTLVNNKASCGVADGLAVCLEAVLGCSWCGCACLPYQWCSMPTNASGSGRPFSLQGAGTAPLPARRRASTSCCH